MNEDGKLHWKLVREPDGRIVRIAGEGRYGVIGLHKGVEHRAFFQDKWHRDLMKAVVDNTSIYTDAAIPVDREG